MTLMSRYDINAMATNISKEFYIDGVGRTGDQANILMDEMRLFAMDMKSRVTFISRSRK